MKDSSIRFRIAEAEKVRIEDFGRRIDKPVSEILRQAVSDAMRGEIPGTRHRNVCATVRRSANRLLDIMDTTPIDISRFREAVATLRTAARELLQCR